MTFTWLNKQGVKSDEGFELQRTARFAMEYREGGVTTKFYVEGGGRGISIYEGDLAKRWTWISDLTRREAERERVLANIRAALAFQGLDLDVAPGRSGPGGQS